MSDFVEQFTTYLQSQDRSAHTVAAYARDVTVFLTWLPEQLGKAISLVEVIPFDVQKYSTAIISSLRGASPPESIGRWRRCVCFSPGWCRLARPARIPRGMCRAFSRRGAIRRRSQRKRSIACSEKQRHSGNSRKPKAVGKSYQHR